MRAEVEKYFLNPPAGSAAARAAEFGTDLTLTLEHLRLTPEERIGKLDNFIEGVAKRIQGELCIVDGVAAAIHGSLLLTNDLDVCYARDIGDLDLPGDVHSVGCYEVAKRAAGRPKDLIALPELEAIQEAQAMEGDKEV